LSHKNVKKEAAFLISLHKNNGNLFSAKYITDLE